MCAECMFMRKFRNVGCGAGATDTGSNAGSNTIVARKMV